MDYRKETLVMIVDYLERIEAGISQCAEAYRVGNMGVANKQIILIIDGLDWTMQAIAVTNDMNSKKVDVTGIKDILEEMVEAMTNNDTTLIADLLEYEILNNVKEWKESMQINLDQEAAC